MAEATLLSRSSSDSFDNIKPQNCVATRSPPLTLCKGLSLHKMSSLVRKQGN